MKTLHVTIRLGVGPDDDGAFDKCSAGDIWNALCRAFPLCSCSAIEVEPVDTLELAICPCPSCEMVRAIGRAYGEILPVDADEFDDGGDS